MMQEKIPTLREILSYRKDTDASIINVSKHNPEDPNKAKTLYFGSIDDIPEEILNLEIIAWLRHSGIYLTE